MTYYYRGRLNDMHYVKNSVLYCVALRCVTARFVTLLCAPVYVTLRYRSFCLQRCVAERYVALQCVALCSVTLDVDTEVF